MKYTVLTYLVGNYDKTHKILTRTPDVDYVIVTDNPLYVDTSGYRVVYDPDLEKLGNAFDKILYIRYHPFKYVDTPIVLKIDASVQVKGDLTKLFQDFEKSESQLAIHLHPTRQTPVEELTAWVQSRGMGVDEANKVLQFMAQFEGYDVKNYKSMVQLSWSMEKNKPAITKLDELAYAVNKYVGGDNDFRCDQVVYSFVIAKYFNQLPIDVWDMRILQGNLFDWYPHGSDTPFKPMKTSEMATAFWLNQRIMPKREQDL